MSGGLMSCGLKSGGLKSYDPSRERERDMPEAGLKEDKTTNRAEWRINIISYTDVPR